MVTMVTTNISQSISDVSNYLSIKFHVRISSTDRNIRDWLLLNCAFIISDVTQSIVLQFFAKLLKKQHFRFLPRKIVQISIFKVEYLENSLAYFDDFGLILQDFERPFRWNKLVLALQVSFKMRFSFPVPQAFLPALWSCCLLALLPAP